MPHILVAAAGGVGGGFGGGVDLEKPDRADELPIWGRKYCFEEKHMAEHVIQIGDIVRLKSGGPKMTVENVGEYTGTKNGAACTWFDEENKKTEIFDVRVLVKVG